MNSYKTLGIVIKRSNYGEADKILTIFTERFGKVKAIAKGVRKIKSKMAGSLEPFMLLELQLYEGKTFYIVTGAVIKEEYATEQFCLKDVSQCFFLGEMIDSFLQENQKAPQLFNTFIEAVELLRIKKHPLVFWYYCLKIIEISGFKPSLFNCIHCHSKLSQEQNYWDQIEGGVICSSCQSKLNNGNKIANNTIKILRLMDQNKGELLEKVKVERETFKELKDILEDYISFILEKEPKSKRFLKLVDLLES